jgi:hypothetical protein
MPNCVFHEADDYKFKQYPSQLRQAFQGDSKLPSVQKTIRTSCGYVGTKTLAAQWFMDAQPGHECWMPCVRFPKVDSAHRAFTNFR